MQVRFAKWGNSIAVRVPKAAVAELGIVENGIGELTIENGVATLRPGRAEAPLPVIDLEALLDGMTPENRHPETDWGPPVGNEFW